MKNNILTHTDKIFSRSVSSSPEPDNNNDDLLSQKIKKHELDPNFIPDPKCGVDIRSLKIIFDSRFTQSVDFVWRIKY